MVLQALEELEEQFVAELQCQQTMARVGPLKMKSPVRRSFCSAAAAARHLACKYLVAHMACKRTCWGLIVSFSPMAGCVPPPKAGNRGPQRAGGLGEPGARSPAEESPSG